MTKEWINIDNEDMIYVEDVIKGITYFMDRLGNIYRDEEDYYSSKREQKINELLDGKE